MVHTKKHNQFGRKQTTTNATLYFYFLVYCNKINSYNNKIT